MIKGIVERINLLFIIYFFVSCVVFFYRFGIFCWVLDVEMKDVIWCGFIVLIKKDEKEVIIDEEEDLFWSKGLMGIGFFNLLLNIVYFYNGKLFGLCGGEYRNIIVRNIRVSDDCFRFEENSLKSFYGGICDFKYVFCVVMYICYERG